MSQSFSFSSLFNNTRIESDFKFVILNLNEDECRIECVKRLECQSFDFHTQMRICEINFHEERIVNKSNGWKHFEKEIHQV